jgi:hypothetical protein
VWVLNPKRIQAAVMRSATVPLSAKLIHQIV